MKRNLIALLTMLGLIASFASSCSDEATILSINSEFDFNVLNDITFEITGNANQISHLEGHNIADGDYEISSSLLTINKNYLVNLMPGKYEFKVWFSHHSENISLTILDKNNQYRLINESFETGNYFGWSSRNVFKGEGALSAFTNDTIVINNEVLDSDNVYGGDGDYVYGLPQEVSKMSFEEKMGYLSSSEFVLGGNGYISFKLGAAKNADLTYLSVVESLTGIEIARFGNSLFDKNLSGLENARLHQYQVDLSAHLGKRLHFEIYDLGGRDWDFITLDNVETFHQEPLEIATEALDIKPLAGLSYAPNQLVNGDFSDDLNHWRISNASGWHKSDGTSDTWRVQNGILKSDSSGDAARGLIRSSFFRVDGSGIVSLEMGAAQGSRFDKDTFVSIKQRGTNHEIIRFANHLHNGNEMLKYFVDLSDYSGEIMYFEIADNAVGSWDTIFIDNIITYYEEVPFFNYGQMAQNLNY